MDPTPLRTMTIAALLDAYPAAGAAFAERGMACVGCAMARFETVEEAAAAYAVELEPFLGELARRAAGSKAAGRPLRQRKDMPRRRGYR